MTKTFNEMVLERLRNDEAFRLATKQQVIQNVLDEDYDVAISMIKDLLKAKE